MKTGRGGLTGGRRANYGTHSETEWMTGGGTSDVSPGTWPGLLLGYNLNTRVFEYLNYYYFGGFKMILMRGAMFGNNSRTLV